jgi:osmoprotectant transport system permease protein
VGATAGGGVIDFLGDVIAWFPDNWWGSAGVANRTWEHIQMSLLATGLAALIAVPPAMYLGHRHRGRFVAVTLVNLGRAVPSFGIVAVALPIMIEVAKRVPFIDSGLGFWPTFVALVALALPPIFTNTYTGIDGVDRDLVEAARGMGFTEREVLYRVEFPVGLPLIIAGLRVASVQVIATATLGALVAWGGLGRYIIDGFNGQDRVQLFAGAILVGILAIATELGFSALERWALPKGLRTGRRESEPAAATA